MSEQHPNQKQVRVRCPKGAKVSKSTKRLASLLAFASNGDRNSFRKSIAIAQHEAKNYTPVKRERNDRPQLGGRNNTTTGVAE
jgi:hypothetical protein